MPYRALLHALAVSLLTAVPTMAQNVVWTERTDLTSGFPATIRMFEGTDPTMGIRAWYVEADPTDPEYVFDVLRSSDSDGVESTSQFAAGSQAFVAINGGYFGAGQSFSLVASDGVVITPNIGSLGRDALTFFPTRGAFGILADGTLDVAWIYDVSGTQYAYPTPNPNQPRLPAARPTAAWPAGGAPWPVRFGIGGGPVLVENGQLRITYNEEVMFGSGVELNDRRPRTAIGYRADGTILLAVFQEATLTQEANVMIQLGAVEALNLDGGGSSTMVTSSTSVFPSSAGSQRQVASAVVLRPPGGGGGGGPVGAQYYFDTGDSCCYRQTGDWFESANQPYYGNTPARLNAVGTGSDRAVFELQGIPSGTYEVAAWWVSSFNRATNTPFDIYHDSVRRRVRVNQTMGGGQWNTFSGTYELAAGDSIVVSDEASGTSTPAFVVVDAIRLTDVTGVATERLPERTLASPSLWPNPARHEVNLRFEALDRGGIGEVVDVLGRTVLRFDVPAGAGGAHLPLPRLAAGVYAVRLVANGSVARTLFVVRP